MKTKNQIQSAINSKMNYATEFITVRVSEVEIYVDRNGEPDYSAIEAIQKDFSTLFGWGGFRTGYGSWILQPKYSSIINN